MNPSAQPVRVLLVEDNPGDADLVRLLLRDAPFGPFEIEHVDRVHKAIKRLALGNIDVVLEDLSLPDSSGMETLRQVSEAAGDIPIVVMTGSSDVGTAVDALARGAQDFLIKGETDGASIARALLYAMERRRFQDRLAHHETLLAEAQHIAQVGSWEWRLDSNECSASEEFFAICGLPPGKLGSGADLLAASAVTSDAARVRAALESAQVGTQPVELEFRLARPDGSVRSVHCRARVLAGSEQQPARIVGTLQDITERKLLEEQVVFSGRMAAVGTLASGVAHEINNPLAYVLANLDLAIEELGLPEPGTRLPEIREWLQEARQGGERVRNIVRDLRVFSRADDERREAVPLARVLESTLNIAHNEIRQVATLHVDIAPTPAVLANEARLGQVFLNLLVNAAQAIAPGSPETNEIRVVARPGPSGFVTVQVHDSGAGMTAAVRERVFDPFFTTKAPNAGTGLGLAICQRIITDMQGSIELQSEPGQGTTFTVRLPETTRTEAEPPPVVKRSAGVKGRLLVIDDEELVLASVRRILGTEHQVTTERSAEAGLARIEAGERFDLVLCDLIMPGMSGMQFHQAVTTRAPELVPHIIFMTGGAFTAEARSFLAANVEASVEKPFDIEALRTLVHADLAKRLTNGG